MNKLLAPVLIAVLTAVSVFSVSVYADRIVVFGATGNLGKIVVREALNRGHEVVGVSRSPEKFAYTEANFIGVAGNPTSLESVLEVTEGADAIINAVGGREAARPEETAMNQSAIAFTEAFAGLGDAGPQLVVVGGGSTMVDSREELIANLPPNAPEGSPFRALFLGHWAAYETYLASDINWTFVAPPFGLTGWRGDASPGDRTGEYRTSTAGPVVDSEGKSAITGADLAVAVVDFAEKGEPNQVKVGLGY